VVTVWPFAIPEINIPTIGRKNRKCLFIFNII
jgi:hypothetical protein